MFRPFFLEREPVLQVGPKLVHRVINRLPARFRGEGGEADRGRVNRIPDDDFQLLARHEPCGPLALRHFEGWYDPKDAGRPLVLDCSFGLGNRGERGWGKAEKYLDNSANEKGYKMGDLGSS